MKWSFAAWMPENKCLMRDVELFFVKGAMAVLKVTLNVRKERT